MADIVINTATLTHKKAGRQRSGNPASTKENEETIVPLQRGSNILATKGTTAMPHKQTAAHDMPCVVMS
jgi:hypothetical protein